MKSIPLSQATEEWRLYAKLELSHSAVSVVQRVSKLRRLARYLSERHGIDDPLVSQITLPLLRSFLWYLSDEEGDCSTTVRGYLEAIRSLFAYCREYDYVSDSPAHRIKLPKKTPPRRELLTDEEEYRLFKAADKLRPERRARMAGAILAVYCHGALRTKELLSLTVSDVIFEGEDAFVQVACGKGGKRRVTPLHRDAVSYLRAYLAVRGEVPYDRLWVMDRRRPLSDTGLSTLFSDLKWYAGIERPNLKPHALRHKRATRLHEDGVDVYSIAQILGHSNIQTTIRYLHGDASHLLEVAQKGGIRTPESDR